MAVLGHFYISLVYRHSVTSQKKYYKVNRSLRSSFFLCVSLGKKGFNLIAFC